MKLKHKFGKRVSVAIVALSRFIQERPLLYRGLQACGGAAAGMLLAGVSVLGIQLPLALALLAALPFGLTAVCAYLGLAVGSCLFWGVAGAIQPVAAGFLILAAACLFHDLQPRDSRWFRPLCAGGLYALVGLLYLLDMGFTLAATALYLARTALVAGGAMRFSNELDRPGLEGKWLLGACLLAGCASITLPGGVPLGLILGAGASLLLLESPRALLAAVLCGLTLDVACPMEISMTVCLCLPALLLGKLPLQNRLVRAGCWFTASLGAALCLGCQTAAIPVGLFFGGLLTLPVPRSLLRFGDASQRQEVERQLSAMEQASGLLLEISALLERASYQTDTPQSAAVFDRAAEKNCRTCPRWATCWESCAADTYLALSGAAAPMLRRGMALREDLPPFFLERCCHVDDFLAAVNLELDNQLCRRQCQARLVESRTILSDQYRYLSAMLQSILLQSDERPEQPCFVPELGCRAVGLRGGKISGDHGESFLCGSWYYLLLCDGMGTGEDAGRQSAAAVRLLTGLIRAGFEPKDAMEMLNGVYLLRGDGGFATVDLLQLSLATGDGYLHKWGAAPSYLKTQRGLQKLGSAQPPPGLGARCKPECIHLNLQRGELLALISDGAGCAEAEEFLRQSNGLTPREIASGIIDSSGLDAMDDRTAAVVRLRPYVASRKSRQPAKNPALRHI